MQKIIPLIPFIILAGALFNIFRGAQLILFAEKIAKAKAGKKKREQKKGDVFQVRINGTLTTVFGLIFLFSVNPQTGFSEKPILRASSHDLIYQEIIEDFLENNRIPGLFVGVIDSSGTHYLTYGNETLGGKEISENSIFEIGSISKLFTGLMLSEAVEGNFVDLNDPIADYLPPTFKRENSLCSEITLKQLTTHTSGLPRVPESLSFKMGMLFSAAVGSNPYSGEGRTKLFQYLSETEIENRKNHEFHYSNFGVGLLGTLICDKKQSSYSENLHDIITGPLDMGNTSIELSQKQKEDFVTGYRGYLQFGDFVVASQSVPWDMDEGFVGAGGIRSCGKDMLKFLKANIDNSLSFTKRATNPLVKINKNRQIAMGWVVDEFENTTLNWHNGQTGGFNSYLGILPGRKTGVFVISNSTVSIQKLGIKILKRTMKGKI